LFWGWKEAQKIGWLYKIILISTPCTQAITFTEGWACACVSVFDKYLHWPHVSVIYNLQHDKCKWIYTYTRFTRDICSYWHLHTQHWFKTQWWEMMEPCEVTLVKLFDCKMGIRSKLKPIALMSEV
jgi:hypothetical protein